MTEQKEAKKPKKRYLSGETYWRMQALLEKGEEMVQDFQKWARDRCREMRVVPSLVDLVEGVVYDNPRPERDGDPPRKPVGCISETFDEVVKDAREKNDAVDAINRELNKLVRQVAGKLHVRVDQVNPRTGAISDDEDDVELVDVDAVEKG